MTRSSTRSPIVKSGDTKEARDFLAFLQSPAAMAAFGRRGFGVE